jgi:hypothetical protein
LAETRFVTDALRDGRVIVPVSDVLKEVAPLHHYFVLLKIFNNEITFSISIYLVIIISGVGVMLPILVSRIFSLLDRAETTTRGLEGNP